MISLEQKTGSSQFEALLQKALSAHTSTQEALERVLVSSQKTKEVLKNAAANEGINPTEHP
jgi:hypothetical protein